MSHGVRCCKLVDYELEIVYILSGGESEIERSLVILTSSLRIVMDRKPLAAMAICDYFEFFFSFFFFL